MYVELTRILIPSALVIVAEIDFLFGWLSLKCY